jgi:hypothetical protein
MSQCISQAERKQQTFNKSLAGELWQKPALVRDANQTGGCELNFLKTLHITTSTAHCSMVQCKILFICCFPNGTSAQ